VITNGGLAGKVTSVTGGTATVTLIVDASSAVSAQVLPDGKFGVVKPKIGNPNDMRLEYLDKNTKVEKGDIFVINPAQQKVVAKIEVGGRPRSVAFLPDGSRAFAACESEAFVAVLDPKAHTVLQKIDLEKGALPMGTAMSADGKELFVSTGRGNSIVVIDPKTNAVVATVPVGGRVWGIALSPDGSKLYTANGASNDVSVVDVKTRKELKRIKVGDGPWGIAIGSAL
jgi:YVTN family beta-propeller protein